LVKNKAKP